MPRFPAQSSGTWSNLFEAIKCNDTISQRHPSTHSAQLGQHCIKYTLGRRGKAIAGISHLRAAAGKPRTLCPFTCFLVAPSQRHLVGPRGRAFRLTTTRLSIGGSFPMSLAQYFLSKLRSVLLAQSGLGAHFDCLSLVKPPKAAGLVGIAMFRNADTGP